MEKGTEPVVKDLAKVVIFMFLWSLVATGSSAGGIILLWWKETRTNTSPKLEIENPNRKKKRFCIAQCLGKVGSLPQTLKLDMIEA